MDTTTLIFSLTSIIIMILLSVNITSVYMMYIFFTKTNEYTNKKEIEIKQIKTRDETLKVLKQNVTVKLQQTLKEEAKTENLKMSTLSEILKRLKFKVSSPMCPNYSRCQKKISLSEMSQHLGKCKESDYRKSQNNLKLNTEEEISWRMTNFKLSNTLIIYKMAESKDWIIIQSRSFKNIYLLSLSCIIQKLLNQYSCTDPLLYAESISA